MSGTVGVGKTNDGTGIAGVNWAVRVQAVRVLGRCGGTLADIADAIRWAGGLPVDGRTNPTPAHVINMSLGGRGACNPVYQRAIEDALDHGTTRAVVVAAGNSAEDARGHQPASCARVITVAASDARGHLVERYSNFGPAVEVMAPGGDTQRDDNGDGVKDGVLSLVAPSAGGYALANGTSMAAPHVAGIVALWLAREPGLGEAAILAKVAAQARPRSASDGCGGDRCGAGLITLAALGPPPDDVSGLSWPGIALGLALASLAVRRRARRRAAEG